MSKDILNLEPQEVWKHFYSLTQIPRPSGHEEKIRSFIAGFGNNLGLETIVDDVGNVIIRKPATPGMENRKGAILQAHLDMVPQKNSGVKHDFEKDPINAVVDGDWVRSDATTLGADNGIGVATVMAVLASTGIEHGPLEALFTSDEECGMTGAFGLKPGLLRGEILLNLDSEDEGELFVGCAGGLYGKAIFRYNREPVPGGYTGVRIKVSGLKGGHSGIDIHLGRGNANKIMNRILYDGYVRHGMLLAAIDGGSLSNAIPRESTATVAVHAYNAELLVKDIAKKAEEIKSELSTVEPELAIEAELAENPDRVIDEGVFFAMLKSVYACPDGVVRMSGYMPDLVETSNNLARIISDEKTVALECLIRSSVDSARDDLQIMVKSVFDLAGADMVFNGGYPGWKPNPDSQILKGMRDIYRVKFGKEPEIRAVHAGLECGIIGATYPALDMISFGPTIRHPHSPDEKVNISSVRKFWDFLVETLRNVLPV